MYLHHSCSVYHTIIIFERVMLIAHVPKNDGRADSPLFDLLLLPFTEIWSSSSEILTAMSRDGRMASISTNGKGQSSNLADASSHLIQSPSEQQRFTYDQSIPPSPCFIHSNLSNGRDPSYFDSNDPSHTYGQSSNSGTRQSNASTSSSNKLNRNRPEPRHRAAQGAVEPESESEESDASTDKNGSSESYTESGSESSEDESDRVRSLTRQLAETAVGVREMSKQLGEL
jgi:hypothetical protein